MQNQGLMKLRRQAISFLLQLKLARRIAHLFLMLHNVSYKYATLFSIYAEPDKLHPKHRLMRYHEWFVQKLQPDWNVLDVGCGNGALAYDLKYNAASIMGIDINEKNIQRAQEQLAKEGVTYNRGDVTQHSFDRPIDAFVLSNVLE